MPQLIGIAELPGSRLTLQNYSRNALVVPARGSFQGTDLSDPKHAGR